MNKVISFHLPPARKIRAKYYWTIRLLQKLLFLNDVSLLSFKGSRYWKQKLYLVFLRYTITKCNLKLPSQSHCIAESSLGPLETDLEDLKFARVSGIQSFPHCIKIRNRNGHIRFLNKNFLFLCKIKNTSVETIAS